MARIKPLPHWALTDLQPAFYDVESVTAIEMVAKVYSKIEELINDYNSYVDEINKTISDFQNGIITDFNEFKDCITRIMNDYIETIDTKINLQDLKIENKFTEQDQVIENAVNYMKNNLIATVTNLYEQGFEHGDYTSMISVSYDNEEEEITILDTMAKAEEEEY